MKETNMEHFRSEIEEIIARHEHYLPAVVDGKPVECAGLGCDKCMLYEAAEPCSIHFVKWLMSEYKSEPFLTAREKHFVEFAQEGWLARDKNDCLHWYKAKPKKKMRFNYWDSETLRAISLGRFEGFPFIAWEDEEPWSVEELRKLKALEYNPEDVAFKKGGSDGM